MKDDIKEKIYNLRAYLGTEENWLLNDILDYITNLQEESKKLNDIIETLKETNNLLINQKYKLEYELDMLDNKRDKAIEWVKKNMYYFPRPNKLLDLLQGEDNGND